MYLYILLDREGYCQVDFDSPVFFYPCFFLPMFQKGIVLFQVVDTYGPSGISLLIIALVETIVIGWVYGKSHHSVLSMCYIIFFRFGFTDFKLFIKSFCKYPKPFAFSLCKICYLHNLIIIFSALLSHKQSQETSLYFMSSRNPDSSTCFISVISSLYLYNLICKKAASNNNSEIHTRFIFIVSYIKRVLTKQKKDILMRLKKITGFCIYREYLVSFSYYYSSQYFAYAPHIFYTLFRGSIS